MSGCLFLLFVYLCLSDVDSLKLEEVFILSRHNLRAPLVKKLQNATPHPLPKWETETAHLTPKGFLLEQYMGEYFNEWFREENLFTCCPKKDAALIYTNTYQRTKQTGRAFAKSAFKNCTVSVLFRNTTEVDPFFHPIIRNNTTAFKNLYTRAMQDKLDNLNLRDSYVELDRIIDFKNSEICRIESFCDLVNTKNVPLFEVGDEPDVYGPLAIGNFMVDSFLMSFYSKKPTDEIAWGKITKEDQWRKLLQFTTENQNVRFNHTLSKDLVMPILQYMKDTLVTMKYPGRKFTMLVGHDSNLSAVMAALVFKSFKLTGQYELTPIGGKIVFQKWREGDEHFLKIEYVYQTIEQLRDGVKLSMVNPPHKLLMEMKDCKTDERGVCAWKDFENILKNIT
jgi:glucose-1-phosphatase